MSRVALLTAAMNETYSRLRRRLEGLTDDEFFWEPIPGCWTIYEDRPGHWTYHYAIPDPKPAPVTSIGWQVVHLATCKIMYREWAFGPGRLTFPEILIPHTSSTAIEQLEGGQQQLLDDLAHVANAQLDDLRPTNWGDLWPAWRVFWTMADHDSFHGGVIGYLRDLYHWSHSDLP
jgi:hypothetical protein